MPTHTIRLHRVLRRLRLGPADGGQVSHEAAEVGDLDPEATDPRRDLGQLRALLGRIVFPHRLQGTGQHRISPSSAETTRHFAKEGFTMP